MEGLWGGRAGSELTIQVSNGPGLFFGSWAVGVEGHGNGPLWLIRSGRGMGRKSRVSTDNFQ